jgi:hypothetical protein
VLDRINFLFHPLHFPALDRFLLAIAIGMLLNGSSCAVEVEKVSLAGTWSGGVAAFGSGERERARCHAV